MWSLIGSVILAQAAAQPGAWESLVDRWGWPGAILAVLGFAGWRFAKFAKPYAVRWADEQIELLKALRESQQKRDENDRRFADQVERFLSADKQQTASIEGLYGRHDRHDEDLKAIREHLESK